MTQEQKLALLRQVQLDNVSLEKRIWANATQTLCLLVDYHMTSIGDFIFEHLLPKL